MLGVPSMEGLGLAAFERMAFDVIAIRRPRTPNRVLR
jgi:hypothetical protein